MSHFALRGAFVHLDKGIEQSNAESRRARGVIPLLFTEISHTGDVEMDIGCVLGEVGQECTRSDGASLSGTTVLQVGEVGLHMLVVVVPEGEFHYPFVHLFTDDAQ